MPKPEPYNVVDLANKLKDDPTGEKLMGAVIGLAIGHQILGGEISELKKRLRALEGRRS